MKQDIKERWIAALRSGEYSQGRNSLKTFSGDYCCLGVLCEIAVRDGVISSQDGPSHTVYGSPADHETSVLPQGVLEWSGLQQRNPDIGEFETYEDKKNFIDSLGVQLDTEDIFFQAFKNNGYTDTLARTTLASLNDAGVPFSKIADIIEQEL